MKHLRNFEDAHPETGSLVTIGVFDGLHLGHQRLIKTLVESADAVKRQAIAVTFFPHPDKVLDASSERYYLTSPEQRAELLIAQGVDTVITLPFDEHIRQLSAAAFVDKLLHNLRMKELHVGADFALGFQREGDLRFLRAQGAKQGFTVQAMDLISAQGRGSEISSSRIRQFLRQGEVAKAREMLGRSYSLSGAVVEGEKRGRAIGFPTANLSVWDEQLIPANGVYATLASLGDETCMAAANIGQRPTFAGDNITIEAHLLDFSGDLYGETVELRFEERLRPERQFNGLAELAAQLEQDVAATRRLLTGLRS